MVRTFLNRNFVATILCLLVWSCGSEESLSPRTAEETVASFQLHPALQAEVFASEPLIRDPVEMVLDEDGRIFVAEMVDYPDYDPPEGQPPRSRVSLLEDRDGDGVIDHSSVFADQLLHATSLLPWKGGLIVTSAPDILYLKDTDGDGKADQREVLFTGFNDQVDPEGRITNLRLSVDNWIYASNHGHEGTVRFLRDPEAPPVSVQGTDFRFRLDKGLFEAASGPTQFGQGVDDWGNRFITQNTIHVRHVVIPWRYLTRNLFLDPGNVSQDISDHGRPAARMFQLTAPQQWRVERTRMRQQRYDEQGVDRVELLSGYFTGASGGTIYDGVSLGEEFRGNLFTGDVSGNLVHRDVLAPQGATFVASRAPDEEEREFLASTDPWFRPCNFAVGPDGSLFIIDIYREFIETPASIPEELKKNMDFHSGTDLGRIYRISRKGSGPYKTPQRLSELDSSELVQLLSHENGWHRRTAHRLLLERADPGITPELRNVVHHGESPQARLYAAYLLESLDQVDEEIARKLINDPHPEVRRHGVLL
ncbi:MAG TPA: PVC-type heme-binding CxxCH protein, partial [Acidobacteriota bacterium]|nr:PVC-type heme-binding CxxCH protein [Acidobacteriota bacterium]